MLKRILLTILALLLPPVAVFAKSRLSWQLLLNVFLCLLFYIPALVHAVWYVARKPKPPVVLEEMDYSLPDEVDEQEEPYKPINLG